MRRGGNLVFNVIVFFFFFFFQKQNSSVHPDRLGKLYFPIVGPFLFGG